MWKEPDVPAYLFFGGLAGASSVLGAAAQLTGHPGLARAAKVAALGGISVSTVALINDLGRPARFHHMLRVFKLSSPMSVGSWILSAYGPAAGAAALSDSDRDPPGGRASSATAGAALLGPAVTTYTAVLLCDTAVPAWHEAHREMPYVFAGSAASAAWRVRPARRAGPRGRARAPAGHHRRRRRADRRRSCWSGACRRRAEPYQTGRAGALLRAGEILTGCGLAGAGLSRRSRAGSAASGLALLAASALTRFGIFEAGRISARYPEYTIVPQRERRQAREAGTRTDADADADVARTGRP